MHRHQLRILKKLMFNPKLRFIDLLNEDITSEHFTYHLQQLIEKGLITKSNNMYLLTDKGKDYVGILDEETLEEEKNPKVMSIPKLEYESEIKEKSVSLEPQIPKLHEINEKKPLLSDLQR